MIHKQQSPASGQTSKALFNNTNGSTNNTTPFRFCSGNAGIIQRRIISYLLNLYDDGFDQLATPNKLVLAGTDAIRQLAQPYKNPIEYISQLRALNGDDCLWSIEVEAARLSNHGKAPAYYFIPIFHRKSWRNTLNGVRHD